MIAGYLCRLVCGLQRNVKGAQGGNAGEKGVGAVWGALDSEFHKRLF